jgi:hypothetical protein
VPSQRPHFAHQPAATGPDGMTACLYRPIERPPEVREWLFGVPAPGSTAAIATPGYQRFFRRCPQPSRVQEARHHDADC